MCHQHKDKDGKPFTTTSGNVFFEHVMTEHVDKVTKPIILARQRREKLRQMGLSKKGRLTI